MNLLELGALGGLVSPLAVIGGMVVAEWRGSKRRAEGAAATDAQRDATDKALAEQIKSMTEAAARADEHLAEGLEHLGRRFDEAITEFKLSNQAHAVHEKDCAQFRGETIAALKSTAEAMRSMAGNGERMAKLEQRMETVEGKIDYGTLQFEAIGRRFEGINRTISGAAFGKEGGAFTVLAAPAEKPAKPRPPRRRSKP